MVSSKLTIAQQRFSEARNADMNSEKRPEENPSGQRSGLFSSSKQTGASDAGTKKSTGGENSKKSDNTGDKDKKK